MVWTDIVQQEMRAQDLSLADVAVGSGVNYDALAKAMQRGTKNPRGKMVENVLSFLSKNADKNVNGKELRPNLNQVAIAELDVRAEGGAGLESPERERTLNHWTVPANIISAHTSAAPDSLKIITVIGSSMEPDFVPGQRVMVDTSDRFPSPPGAFALWDGYGLVIKYVEIVPRSDPECVKLISANKAFGDYKVPVADLHINGRVIGKWQWT